MTSLETKNSNEGASINTVRDSDISLKNTELLRKDLQSLEPIDKNTFDTLMSKLNYWDVSKAGTTDMTKGTNVEKNIGGITSKKDAVNRIIAMGLISKEDINTLDPLELTKKIQKGMYERIIKDPIAKNKLDKFLEKVGMPNAGELEDGKFGARSLIMLQMTYEIPPNTVPDTPPNEKPNNVVEVEKKADFINIEQIGRIKIPVEFGGGGAGAYVGSINRIFLRSTGDHSAADIPYYIIKIDDNIDHVRGPYNKDVVSAFKQQIGNNFIVHKDTFYENNMSQNLTIEKIMSVMDKHAGTDLVAKVEKSDVRDALYKNNAVQNYVINTLAKQYPNAQDIQKAVKGRTSTMNNVAKN